MLIEDVFVEMNLQLTTNKTKKLSIIPMAKTELTNI
jgi:hypothetical protein